MTAAVEVCCHAGRGIGSETTQVRSSCSSVRGTGRRRAARRVLACATQGWPTTAVQEFAHGLASDRPRMCRCVLAQATIVALRVPHWQS